MGIEWDLLVFREDLMDWYDNHGRDFPWREPDCSVYEVFVAQMLLRKTTATVVAETHPKFVSIYPSFDSLIDAEVDELSDLLEPLGLQNKRAAAFKEIASLCRDGLPTTRSDLLELPHVGPYIADSTLCFGYGRPQPVIDSNIARIYARLSGEEFGTGHEIYRNDQLSEMAERVLPTENYQEFNWALLDFGAKICTAQSPNCETCFASDYCAYFDEVEADTS